MNPHCLIALTEGRLVRDLLENDLLDFLADGGARVTLATPADRVPSFTARWNRDGLRFVHLFQTRDHPWLSRAVKVRKRLAASWPRPCLQAWLNLEHRLLFKLRPEYAQLLVEDRPNLVVATNATPPTESELVFAARRAGIPTLGVVGSWDRLHKFLYTRTEHLSVWSDLNRDESFQMEGYEPTKVHVTGPTQLDAYFGEDVNCSRESTCVAEGLDPARPYIFLATAGSFVPAYDETYLLEWLLSQIGSGALPRDLQVLCRLHPFSRLEYFLPYAADPRVKLSHMGYIPTLGASMTRREVVQFGNLVRHAAAVVTPGSTLTLEAAIFDTPTVVPVFHSYQAELCERYYRTRVFGRHFRRIQEQNLVPIVHGAEELLSGVRRCLKEPAWYRDQRARLVRDYIQFTDGKSTRRLASLILQLAGAPSVKSVTCEQNLAGKS